MTQSNIGRVHYVPARAAMVRDDEGAAHSAVHGTFAVYTSTKKEVDTIIARWPDIMAEISETVEALIAGDVIPDPVG